MIKGRTLGLYGDTGSGKTTQIGELAKWHYRRTKGTTLLATCDRGGFLSLKPLISVGIIRVQQLGPTEDPWGWIADAVSGKLLQDTDCLLAIDSATSIGELIFDNISKADRQIGQQRTQRFNVGSGHSVGINNESHYGLVQGFLRDMLWKSTWLAQTKGVDVLWTFATLRGEKQDSTVFLGPEMAGKALTPKIARWLERTFRIVSIPQAPGEAPRHVLHLQEQPDFGGTGMSQGNARYPMDATTPLPATLEPADLGKALELIEEGEKEAEDKLRRELGL